jgi:phage/plasmid-associated DNA primase
MPRLRTPLERASIADTLVTTFGLVEYQGSLYMPQHFTTREPFPATPEETIWVPLSQRKVMAMANFAGILFLNDGEIRSFVGMLRQLATQELDAQGLLVNVDNKEVKLLGEDGKLHDVTGDFVPNYLDVPYQSKNPLADELFKIIVEWLGSEEQARSLLHHLATILQPGFSAVKYVLMLGKGRNGKSTLLKMLKKLIGADNVSGVKRQDMAVTSVIMKSLNNKLANIVFDGPKEFLKDSSTEKTLIAGEELVIELKYENEPVTIQTNALFIEGLQQEPKVSDKSVALQKRLVRFWFPNEYALDLKFEERMLKPDMLAALLHLLLMHWVNRDEVATKLALTVESMDLQMESVWQASSVLRFLEETARRDPQFLTNILAKKMMTDVFLTSYRPWLDSNGYKNMEDDYLLTQLNDHFTMDRKSFRVEGRTTTRRYIKTVSPDTLNVMNRLLAGHGLEDLKGDEADVLNDAMEG